jgi:hypothetical protein
MSLENKHLRLRNTSYNLPKLSFAILLMQLMLVPIANAIEMSSIKQWVSQCALLGTEPQMLEGTYFVHYIQDFIHGDIETDAQVMLNEPAIEVVDQSLLKNDSCKL